MSLHQVIPGAVNTSSPFTSFKIGYYINKPIVAYACNNKVVLLTSKLVTLQILVHEQDNNVLCLDWCQTEGRLATGTDGNIVYIYTPSPSTVDTEIPFTWSKLCQIKLDFRVASLSWRPWGDRILTAGASLAMWQINYDTAQDKTQEIKEEEKSTLVWKSSGAMVPVKYCTFSPDGKYFATLGEFDRLVKVWYKYNEDHFGFIYLPHPRSVSTVIWRRKHHNHSTEDNVLMTVCRSNVVRLWLETPQAERFQFTVCSVIEPGPPGTVVDFMNARPSALETQSDLPVINEQHSSKPKTSRHSKVSTDQRTSLDWIVSIQKSGMAIIWKVKGLIDRPKHTPNFSIWSRFSVYPAQGMASHQRLIALAETFSNDGRNCPVKFNLYVLSSSGAINCWECIEEGNVNPRVTAALASTCFGHKSPIFHIIKHPYLPFIASIDKSQRCIVWKSVLSTTYNELVEVPFILNNVATFDNSLLFAWTLADNIVLTSNSRGVFVYEIELSVAADGKQKSVNPGPTSTLLGLLSDSDQFCPLVNLLVFDSEGGQEWRIVGVSEGGEEISLWSMTRSHSDSGKGAKQVIPASLQIGQLLGTKKLPSASRVTAVASSSHFYTSKPAFSLITGNADGTIKLWKLDPVDDSPMQEAASFKLHDEQISMLQPGPFGLLASTTISAKNVYIWQFDISGSKQSHIRISLKHTIPLSSSANLQYLHYDWLSLYDGDAALAIADGPQLDLYVQKPKLELRSFGPILERQELHNLPLPIQSIGWMQDGTLVCSGLTQGFVFTKWCKPKSAFSTLFHAFSDTHAPLPFYHPRILVELLIEGNFEQTGATLKHLFTFLDALPEETSRVEYVPSMAFESLQAQSTTSNNNSKEDAYNFLDTSTSSLTLDTEEKDTKTQLFTTANAKRLSEILTRITLPRVTGKEQMYLLAVIDTFSQMQETQGAIDQCGMKFLLAYKMYSFLRRSLPPAERPVALTSTDFIWALHSEAEDALLQICFPAEGNWATARSLGIGLWLRKPTTLKALVEKIAKTQFTASKDPHDCFLFYLALNKKPALVALFKAVKNMPVHDFLKNDFNLDKWKTAALKNAYVLLGKQKFELAAAFFLLGGQLKDCVDVCIKKLGDYQLALLVARLVEGDNGPRPVFDYILTSHILPFAQQNKDHSLASISMWLLKKYAESVSALLPDEPTSETASSQQSTSIPDPALLHVFKFLRSHTMLRDSTLKFDDIHFDLVKKTALTYSDSGYSILAVDQLKWLLDTLSERKKKAAANKPSGFNKRFLFDAPPVVQEQETQAVDPAFLFRIALQLLSQQILDSSKTKFIPSDNKLSLLKQNFTYLCTKLNIDQELLRDEILTYCEQRYFITAQYQILSGDPEQQVSVLCFYANQILSLSTGFEVPEMSDIQLGQLLSITRQLFECSQQPDVPLSTSQKTEVLCATQFGLFLYCIKNSLFGTMHSLFQGKPIEEVFKVISSDQEEKLREHEVVDEEPKEKTIAYGEAGSFDVDADVQTFLNNLFNFLIFTKLIIGFEMQNQNANSSRIADTIACLKRWKEEMKDSLGTLPDRITKAARQSHTQFLSLFSEFMKRTPSYKRSRSFGSLWEYLCKELVAFIAELPLDIEMPIISDVEEDHEELKFLETVALYKDRDILQSFCVNSVDPLQIAMATTRGIKEITLSKDQLFLFSDDSDTDTKELGEEANAEGATDSPRQPRTKQDHVFPFRTKHAEKKIPNHAISRQADYNVLVQWLETHPVNPYYLSGGIDGSICLWQFGVPKDNALMVTYRLASNPRVNKIHFNSRGTKFGSCDMSGKLSLWRFDASEASLRPFQTLQCHSKRTLDFTFLNSGSVIASAGISYDKRNVCLWDTLLPTDRSMVCSFSCHDSGASSLIYSPRHQLLITGGKKGDIVIFDIRQQKMLDTIKAHNMNVKSLALDPQEDFIISGSNEGNVKVWDLPTLKYRECWEGVHSKQTFVRKPGVFAAPVSTFGVMQVALDYRYMYTCGSDGRMLRTAYQKNILQSS